MDMQHCPIWSNPLQAGLEGEKRGVMFTRREVYVHTSKSTFGSGVQVCSPY